MSDISPGTVAWFEIGTTDVEDVTRFYGGLFEWRFEPRSPEYTEIVAPGGTRPIGGIFTPGDELSLSILTPDVSGDLEKIRLAGATVVKPASAPEGEGIVYARLRDPLGNPFTLYSDERQQPLEIVEGALDGFEIGTTVVDTTKGFYFECFGWTFDLDLNAPESPSPASCYNVISRDHRRIGRLVDRGLYGKDYAMPLFRVADEQSSVEKARSLGATIYSDPDDSGTRLLDPQGNRFGLTTGR
ncbi:VOC family protein [Nonomuraea sp. NPDC059194]|uniref:VOC family protein n=1 Tax=Nonomuraea sp. NPDC059194 TaxID=3346764 RepID=UPI0036915940